MVRREGKGWGAGRKEGEGVGGGGAPQRETVFKKLKSSSSLKRVMSPNFLLSSAPTQPTLRTRTPEAWEGSPRPPAPLPACRRLSDKGASSVGIRGEGAGQRKAPVGPGAGLWCQVGVLVLSGRAHCGERLADVCQLCGCSVSGLPVPASRSHAEPELGPLPVAPDSRPRGLAAPRWSARLVPF